MASTEYVTVRKNWKKKIEALCEGMTEMDVFSLETQFRSGVVYRVEEGILETVTNMINGRAKLTYNKVTGGCSVRVHSNLWYSWTNKIEW
jgi:hypothetical protein